jgi:hypothetical protein
VRCERTYVSDVRACSIIIGKALVVLSLLFLPATARSSFIQRVSWSRRIPNTLSNESGRRVAVLFCPLRNGRLSIQQTSFVDDGVFSVVSGPKRKCT